MGVAQFIFLKASTHCDALIPALSLSLSLSIISRWVILVVSVSGWLTSWSKSRLSKSRCTTVKMIFPFYWNDYNIPLLIFFHFLKCFLLSVLQRQLTKILSLYFISLFIFLCFSRFSLSFFPFILLFFHFYNHYPNFLSMIKSCNFYLFIFSQFIPLPFFLSITFHLPLFAFYCYLPTSILNRISITY